MGRATTMGNLCHTYIPRQFQRFIGFTPLKTVIVLLIIVQLMIWCTIFSPKLGFYCLILFLFIVLSAFSIEYGVLAIIVVIPWAWQAMNIQVGSVSLKASYVLIVMGCVSLVLKMALNKNWTWSRTSLDLPLFAFLAINILAVITSIEPFWSLREALQIVLYVAFFFLITNIFRTEASIRRASKVAILATVLVVLNGFLGDGHDHATRTEVFRRFYGGFDGPNTMANYLFIGFPLAFAYTLDRSRSLVQRLPYILATAILSMGLLLSYSRAGWAVGVLVLVLVSYLGESKWKATVTVLLIAIVLLAGVFRAPLFKERIVQITSSNESSNLSHIYQWKAGWYMIKDHPITGIGTGAYPRYFDKYFKTPALPEPVVLGQRVYFDQRAGYGVVAHNAVLQMWAEIGTLGFLTFLFIIGLFIKDALTAVKRATGEHQKAMMIGLFVGVIGVLLHNMSITNLVDHFWASLGIAIAGARVINNHGIVHK